MTDTNPAAESSRDEQSASRRRIAASLVIALALVTALVVAIGMGVVELDEDVALDGDDVTITACQWIRYRDQDFQECNAHDDGTYLSRKIAPTRVDFLVTCKDRCVVAASLADE